MSLAGPLPRGSHRSPQGEGTPVSRRADPKVNNAVVRSTRVLQ